MDNMKNKFFCEVVRENDPIIKFQIVNATFLNEVVDMLKHQYTIIKEWVVKDLTTGARYTNKQ